MMPTRIGYSLGISCLSFLLTVCANAQTADAVAEIVALEGVVEVLRKDADDWQRANVESALYQGDAIRTGANAKVYFRSNDESLISLNRNSVFVFKQVAPKAGWLPTSISGLIRSVYEFCSGTGSDEAEMSFINKNQNIDIDVSTPLVTASVRGTAFTLSTHTPDCVAAEDSSSVLTMLEGQVLAVNAQDQRDRLVAESGDRVIAEPGQALRLQRLLIKPEDAVQWALLIPPLFDSEQEKIPALQAIYDQIQAGQITQADRQLQILLKQQPQSVAVWRLKALIDLMLNRKQETLAAAEQSTRLAPQSASAWITLSYAQQANFELPQATVSIRQALQLEPDNVLALVNLARLLFAREDIDNAWHTLEKALRIAPEQAEVQNLRGFLLLARQDTAAAIAAFQNAVRVDQRLSEPHLGLSLAYMRQGDEQRALQSITTAVLLEPQRSLLLSYWAKILYQLKRFEKALDILKLARQYDPDDPTPWLYEGLILRDLNRPTEAIKAINQAMQLNDRRAVYRSRFLLDRDLAVKNADLSQIYRQLGLTAWAKNKALASIKQDYGNASAHTFLAGVFSEENDRAGALSSEALLGRLLQPGSVNSFNSYNDYTTLLEQPAAENSLSVGAGKGNSDRFNSEWLSYGASPEHRLAYGVALSHSGNSGWRETNDEQLELMLGKLKWDLSATDSVLFSASYQRQRFEDEFFPRLEVDFPADPNESLENRSLAFELGYHHRFGPGSDLMFLFNYSDFSVDKNDYVFESIDSPTVVSATEIFTQTETDSPYYQAQGQYVIDVGKHQLITGTLHYWLKEKGHSLRDSRLLDDDGNIVISDAGNPVQVIDRIPIDSDSRFQSYYLQDIWNFSANWTIETALHFESLKITDLSSSQTQRKLNPRFGVIWTPTEQDTFRVAAFRYLVPRFSTRLDPTDIAGISIYRNALEGSLTREADIAWEREWNSGFFAASAFYQERELSIGNFNETGRLKGVELEWNQLLPWSGTALTANYRYLDAEDNDLIGLLGSLQISDPPVFSDRREHQFTLGLNYVSPNGLFAGFQQTYRQINSVTENRPDEDIWVTDFRIGYEFADKTGGVQLGVRNMFDQQFNWVLDPFAARGLFNAPRPEREIFATFSINF